MDWKVKNIGRLQGPVLVFGGPYSNLQATEVVREYAERRGIIAENVICTGDVVAYCARPEETVRLIMDWGIHVIAGNVEIQLREGLDDCGCNFSDGSRCDVFSRQWYPFAQAEVSPESVDWMRNLPHHLRFQFGDLHGLVVHGSPENVSEYVFESTDWGRKKAFFASTHSNLILAGHSGLPFAQSKEGLHWVNAGVIGMPANDGTTRTWCCVIEAKGEELATEFVALEYDHQLAHQEMLVEGLPLEYAKTLLDGRWDNCEILPEVETCQAGQRLEI